MSETYAFGPFRLDVSSREIRRDGVPIKLTNKAFAILALLAERAPEVVTRAEFDAAIWPQGYIEPANLTQTVYVIRKSLATPASAAPIETVNGRGYRLTVPVRRVRDDLLTNAELGGWLRRLASSLALIFTLPL